MMDMPWKAAASDQPVGGGGKSGVLIISSGADEHGDAVARELAKRKVSVWRWNLDAFPRSSALSIRIDSAADDQMSGVLRTADCHLPLENVRSVLFGRDISGLFASRDRAGDDLGVFVRLELEAVFRGLADALRGAFWVNPPLALHAIDSQVTHLQAAVAAGLPVPRTLVTTDAGAARDFYDAMGGRVVAKSFGVPTTRMPDPLEHLSANRCSPHFFQEQLPYEADVRVLIIGRQIFAAECHATQTEYRQCALPATAAVRCQRLLHRWGVSFGEMDLIRRPDGQHLFLSFNAAAEWLWLEAMTGQPITAAVADLLEWGFEAPKDGSKNP